MLNLHIGRAGYFERGRQKLLRQIALLALFLNKFSKHDFTTYTPMVSDVEILFKRNVKKLYTDSDGLARPQLTKHCSDFLYPQIVISETGGFEPPIPFRVYRISSAARSTTLPRLHYS